MLYRFFAIALFTVGTVSSVAHEGEDHLVLVNTGTTTKLEYFGGYTATWRAKVIKTVDPKKTDQKKNKQENENIVEYTLTLERPASDKGEKPISLYNLRLQGGSWGVTIKKAGPGLTFYKSLADCKKGTLADRNTRGEWLIPSAGAGAGSGAKPDKIAMMKWDASGGTKCTIVVYSDRKINGPLAMFGKDPQAEIDHHNTDSRQNHHSEPPPGTPGGEEGESSNLAR